jgi:hypothetical protein
MKPEVMLELLESTADQLGIKVSYEPLQSLASGMRGGLCKVKGVFRVIIDKRATNEERMVTLASALSGFNTSDLVIPQKVRDLLRTYDRSTNRPASGPAAGPRRAA